MGFLDRKSRVLDIVLTGRGRELFATGELNFSYYAFFDDGIDYDPWSSGSLTAEEVDDLIHSSPMLEPHSIQDRRSTIIPLEPTSFLFNAATDYTSVPKMTSPNPTGSVATLRCDQFSSGSSFIRTGTNIANLPLELSSENAGREGFSIHVYSSGSNGVDELKMKFDLRGRKSFDPFISFSVDDEEPQDAPSVEKPDSRRYQK